MLVMLLTFQPLTSPLKRVAPLNAEDILVTFVKLGFPVTGLVILSLVHPQKAP